jgi:hypothetical protein
VHRAGLEHLAVRQRVGDVAGQAELLDPLRQRCVWRRLRLAGVLLLRHSRSIGALGNDLRGVRIVVGRWFDRLLLAPEQLAALQHRRVVRLVAGLLVVGLGSLLPARLAAEPDGVLGLHARGVAGLLPRYDGAPAQHVERGPDPDRDQVHRRAGHHQRAEGRQQHQQRRGDVLGEQVRQQRGDHVPDRAARLLQRAL